MIKVSTYYTSRSGANAIAVWMIMRTYGSEGWKTKVANLLSKTDRLCDGLDNRGVSYFRNPSMNIIAIDRQFISKKLAKKYLLVPDSHEDEPRWWKIVSHAASRLLYNR